jgi:hypothetical protein
MKRPAAVANMDRYLSRQMSRGPKQVTVPSMLSIRGTAYVALGDTEVDAFLAKSGSTDGGNSADATSYCQWQRENLPSVAC